MHNHHHQHHSPQNKDNFDDQQEEMESASSSPVVEPTPGGQQQNPYASPGQNAYSTPSGITPKSTTTSNASSTRQLMGSGGGGGDLHQHHAEPTLSQTVSSLHSRVTILLLCFIFVALISLIILILVGVGLKDISQVTVVSDKLTSYQSALESITPGLSAGSPSTWEKISPTNGVTPHGRLAHAACSVGRKMYIHGGIYGRTTNVFDDLWVYDEALNQWTELTTSGDKPSARLHHTMIDTADQKTLLLFGGFNNFQGQAGHDSFDDLYKLDLATLVWTKLIPVGSMPTKRGAHDCTWMGSPSSGAMYCFGGFAAIGGTGHLDEMWKYDLNANSWTDLTPATKHDWDWPDGRIGFSLAAISDSKFHMFAGGCSVDMSIPDSDSVAGQCGDDWIFDVTTNKFSMMNLTAGSATPGSRRATHGDVAAFGLVFLYGGVYINGTSEVKMYDDLWVLQPDPAEGGPRWMQLFPNYNLGTRPPKLFGHSVVRLGQKVVIFGGRAGSPLSDGTSDIWEYGIVKPL